METISEKVQRNEKIQKDGQTSEAEGKEADFEEAMVTAGFGLYNLLVLVGALFTLTGAIFETSAISYVLPNAECDLKLTLLDKGVINAVTYGGMIAAAFPCGYLSDAFGRKKILLYSCLLHGLSVLCLSLSQNVTQLLVFKFFGGVFMCGPSAAIMTYVMEMHGKRHRERILMLVGSMLVTASLLLPLMALGILTSTWTIEIFGLAFNHWKAFLAVSAIPSLIAGLLFILLPESPKFLLSKNKPDEALEVLRSIFSVNKFKPRNTFPINHLKENEDEDKTTSTVNVEHIEVVSPPSQKGENTNQHSSGWSKFRESILLLKPMLHKPLLGLALQIYSLNFFILLGKNTLRLWLPQLFASINEYEKLEGSGSADMCNILAYSLNKTETLVNHDKCEVSFDGTTYYNNIIVAAAGFLGYIVAGSVINQIGAVRITTISLFISGIFGLAMYWSSSSLMTLIFAACFSTVSSLSGTSLIGTSVNLFPTNLRTMVVALQMMFGRVGSLAGNILFPTFISFGCIPPFLLLGGSMLAGSFMSAFLPNKSGSSLK